jgi:hypothetical protein
MSCRTGPLRVARPLRGVYTLSRQDQAIVVLPLVGMIVADQREAHNRLPPQDKLKRRANARPTRSGPVRQDSF